MNLYTTLGVGKNATETEIRDAYRKRAFVTHPDRERGSTGAFKEVQEAYAILSDSEKRQRYDETGKTDRIPNEAAQAWDLIFQIYMEIAQGSQFAKRNYLKDIRDRLDVAVHQNALTEEAIEKQYEALSYLADHTKGLDVLVERMRSKAESLLQSRNQCRRHICMIKGALKLLEKASYDGEDLFETYHAVSSTHLTGGS